MIALNKKDLANPNIMHVNTLPCNGFFSVMFIFGTRKMMTFVSFYFLQKWVSYFDSCKQHCIPINAHSKSSVKKVS